MKSLADLTTLFNILINNKKTDQIKHCYRKPSVKVEWSIENAFVLLIPEHFNTEVKVAFGYAILCV